MVAAAASWSSLRFAYWVKWGVSKFGVGNSLVWGSLLSRHSSIRGWEGIKNGSNIDDVTNVWSLRTRVKFVGALVFIF